MPTSPSISPQGSFNQLVQAVIAEMRAKNPRPCTGKAIASDETIAAPVTAGQLASVFHPEPSAPKSASVASWSTASSATQPGAPRPKERLVYARPRNAEECAWLADQVSSVLAYRIGIGDWQQVQDFCRDLLMIAFENGCYPTQALKLDATFAQDNAGACRARVGLFCRGFLAPAVKAESWREVAAGAQAIYGVAWAKQQG